MTPYQQIALLALAVLALVVPLRIWYYVSLGRIVRRHVLRGLRHGAKRSVSDLQLYVAIASDHEVDVPSLVMRFYLARLLDAGLLAVDFLPPTEEGLVRKVYVITDAGRDEALRELNALPWVA